MSLRSFGVSKSNAVSLFRFVSLCRLLTTGRRDLRVRSEGVVPVDRRRELKRRKPISVPIFLIPQPCFTLCCQVEEFFKSITGVSFVGC